MRGLINDCMRWLIGNGIVWIGLVLSVAHRIRIRTFSRHQRRLRRSYGIRPDTPVLAFGYELEQLIKNAAARNPSAASFAETSGSTSRPKRILYTKSRLRAVRLAYIDFFARACWSLPIKRKSLYVFSSFIKDDSLTSLMLEETGFPPFLSSLQAPYRVQSHPAIQSLVTEYGVTATRLWLLTISNPGVLYATNPSTLSLFLDELSNYWKHSSRLIKDWCEKPEAFDKAMQMIASRIESRGSASRLKLIATSEAPLPLHTCIPATKAYICWEGGYVKPFLDRVKSYLPPERYRLIPMYSMSTETLETVCHFDGNSVAYLPLASAVLYEFIEEGADDHPENLRTFDQLQLGKAYSMVVSDPYGLRRYQTGDVFMCRGFTAELPNLHFLRRRDLEYSFTGEKLTSEHVSAAFQKLRGEYPQLGAHTFLTCVPSQSAESAPHYKIALVDSAITNAGRSFDQLARRCDQLFSEINSEYKSKRESGRLGPVRFTSVSPEEFIGRMGDVRQQDSWESQFKFLPLYRRTWENNWS